MTMCTEAATGMVREKGFVGRGRRAMSCGPCAALMLKARAALFDTWPKWPLTHHASRSQRIVGGVI
jgi:hypothetical protein